MAHFHPLTWHIDLRPYSEADLLSNPIVQAIFVHEYVHYLQALTGTFGRCLLSELVRTMVFAGHFKAAGCRIAEIRNQIDLMATLNDASKADFAGSSMSQQYGELRDQVRFVLSDDVVTKLNGAQSHRTFFFQPIQKGRFRIGSFVHLETCPIGGQPSGVPLTDRILFENMARQVQRNYLLMNNSLDTSPVDSLRTSAPYDLTYVCLHDLISSRLDTKVESPAKWTIVLCQLSLLCQHPGNAFFSIWELFERDSKPTLDGLLRAFNQTKTHALHFNHPPLQDILNSLIQEYGTAIRMTENGELHDLTKLIVNAANAFISDPFFLASPLLTWNDVLAWLPCFGCPPVDTRMGRIQSIAGVPLASPWQSYFSLTDQLLT